MKVYEAIAEIMERERVDAVFGVMGDANMKWLTEYTERTERTVYYTRHEGAAVAMADGYARATGKLAVCTVTCGPGLTLLATALIASSRARVPVLVIAGDAPRADKYYEQAIDQRRFVESCETMSEDLRSAASIDEDLRDAFFLTRTVGPVVFNAPFDVQEDDAIGHDDYVPTCDFVEPRQQFRPDRKILARAIEAIQNAERPIIIGGRGAIAARERMIELADATGALLGTSMKAKGLFDGDPRDLGLVGGFAMSAVRERFADADVVISVGASMNHYTMDHGALFPQATVVQILDEPVAQMNGRRRPQSRPGGRKMADVYVYGSAQPTLEEILAALDTSEPKQQWAPTPAPLPVPETEDDDPDLHQGAVMYALNEAAHEDSRFVIGPGHYWWFPFTYLRDRWTADSYQVTAEFGAIGQVLTEAIGAAIGRPDRKVVAIEGDASVLMQIQELDTAVRYGVDMLLIVMNDRGLGAEALKLEASGHDASTVRIPTPDFVGLVKSMGGDGAVITDLDDFRGQVRRFQEEGGVRLLDVHVSQRVLSGQFAAKLGKPYEAVVTT
jgi:thiamine pyrophosphate-dependent acetolactate synthase large subunit-like protein